MLKKYSGEIMLLIASFIWGTGLVTQKFGVDFLDPMSFTAIRSLLGALVLVPVIFVFRAFEKRKGIPQQKYSVKPLIIGALLCGTSYFLASYCQQVALTYISVGKNGFLIAMYVVLIPIISIFLRRKPPLQVWIGIGIAVVGFYLLCMKEGLSIGIGEGLALLSAVLWAVEILCMGGFVQKVEPLKMTCAMFVVSGLWGSIASFAFNPPAIGDVLACWAPLSYNAVFVVGLSFALQAFGQRRTNPTVAGLICSLEAVFSVLSGVVILGETMELREWAGCVCLFAAMIITVFKPVKKEATDKVNEKDEITQCAIESNVVENDA